MKGKIFAYLRASSKEQDAARAQQQLTQFIAKHEKEITSYTYENESGRTLERPKLMHLLDSMHSGDVLLVESVDRLSRLNADDWAKLKRIIDDRGVVMVVVDLPTSHAVLTGTSTGGFTGNILKAINSMLLDFAAASAEKDYEDRRRRQTEGIAKAQAKGKFRGRPINAELHKNVLKDVAAGNSQRWTAINRKCSLSTVQRIIKANKQAGDGHLQQALLGE